MTQKLNCTVTILYQQVTKTVSLSTTGIINSYLESLPPDQYHIQNLHHGPRYLEMKGRLVKTCFDFHQFLGGTPWWRQIQE